MNDVLMKLEEGLRSQDLNSKQSSLLVIASLLEKRFLIGNSVLAGDFILVEPFVSLVVSDVVVSRLIGIIESGTVYEGFLTPVLGMSLWVLGKCLSYDAYILLCWCVCFRSMNVEEMYQSAVALEDHIGSPYLHGSLSAEILFQSALGKFKAFPEKDERLLDVVDRLSVHAFR